MPVLNRHGGYCCGVRHIHSFGTSPTAAGLSSFREAMASAGREFAVEAVLTSSQLSRRHPLTGKTWAEVLKDAGFNLVERSRNPNTGAILNIFIRPSRRVPASRTRFTYNKTARV